MTDIPALSSVLTAPECQPRYTSRGDLYRPANLLQLHQRIREARELVPVSGGGRARVSQEEFAALVGVTRSAVANWETDKARPDVDNLATIATVSGCAFEWLATGRGPKVFGAPQVVAEPRGIYVDDPVELKILAALRNMPARQRRAVLDVLRIAANDER